MTCRIHKRACRLQLRRWARGISRQTLCLLLALSLWHAPIPWIHAHDLRGPVVDQLASLHQHVEEFHSGEVEEGETHLSMHAHLVLPWRSHQAPAHAPDGSDRPDSDEADFAFLFGMTATSLSMKAVGRPLDRAFYSPHAAVGAPVAQLPVWGGAPLYSLSHGRHFFATFGRAVSIGDLCCVRLC